jgi:hypothetical protein
VAELKDATATPNVSSTSNVRGMSRMDFTPAQTTHILVRLNSIKSAEFIISNECPHSDKKIPSQALVITNQIDQTSCVSDDVVSMS